MAKWNNTTFVFGAGASLHAGYPFVASMGGQLFKWMRKPRKAAFFDFAQCAEALEERFGDNIESVFKGIGAEIKRQGPDYPTFANRYRPALVEALRQWFAEIHRQHTSPAYERFAAEIVRPGDEIVTFNYDVSLDSQLRRSGKWCIGDGYGFRAEGLPCGSAVSVLKLHGSINWFAPMFRGMTGIFAAPAGIFGHRPAFTNSDSSALGYLGTIDPLFPRQGSSAIQPLIFPTNRKQFFFETNFFGREWTQFWDRLWRKARQAVRTSRRVVICGYGMYPIDRRGCNLLLTGELAGDVEVCCGRDSARIVQQLRTHSRRAREAEELFFEDWVSAQCDKPASV